MPYGGTGGDPMFGCQGRTVEADLPVAGCDETAQTVEIIGEAIVGFGARWRTPAEGMLRFPSRHYLQGLPTLCTCSKRESN